MGLPSIRCCAIDWCVESKTKDFSSVCYQSQTFKKAFELCQASELAEKNAKELQAGKKQSLKMAGASVMVSGVRGW